MTAPAQEKTRRGVAGSLWGQVAREIARVFYQGAPLFALGVCLGLMIGLEARL
jgi:surfactin synthase thioesterase subunit